MEASRQQLHAFRSNKGTRPVLEEFIPIKQSNSQENCDQKASNISDKANWMTSVQLWSQASEGTKPQSTINSIPKESDNNIGFMSVSPKLGLDNKHRSGGAFLPFSKERNSFQGSSASLRALPELAIASSEKEMEEKKCADQAEIVTGSKREDSSGKGEKGAVASEAQTTSTNTTSGQAQRKARRCWSPDLHRRFVNALQMLGGSQGITISSSLK